jgi:predicted transcriptional regulator
MTNQQELVLKIIQDYLDNNRILELDKIVPYIRNTFSKSSININDNGIKLIIKTLIENRQIIQGSKLTKKRILTNANRKKIYLLIKEHPGINLNRIITMLNLSYHVVSWHVNILLKFSCIKKIQIKTKNIYFHFDVPPSMYNTLYLLSKKNIKKILKHIKEKKDNGVTKSSLSNDLKANYTIISNSIDQLEKVGILIKESFSKKTVYYFSENYYSIVDHL